MASTYAIIPAAGQGRRFGKTKQFELLGNKPVLLHTLEALESSPLIQGMSVVVPEADTDKVQSLIRKAGLKKVFKVLPGGDERQDSVKRGFQSLPACEIVLVHDGVRPFLTSDLIKKVVMNAREFGGSVAGVPVRETVKKVDEDLFVADTVDRSTLWSIQTPQAFRHEIFQKALEKAEKDHFLGTDEAMLVERLGIKIRVIEGSAYNIKITTLKDLKVAEAILKAGF